MKGQRVSEGALLNAQRNKIVELETAARAGNDTVLLELATAALREGPEAYDSMIAWANRRDDASLKVRVPKARAYVVLYSDGSGRWKAGDVGVALPNTFREKYDVLIDFGGRMEPVGGWGPKGPQPEDLMLNRQFFQHAQGVAPCTKAMLPGVGEEPAKYTFDVHREASRSRRASTWRHIGMVRARSMDEAVAEAVPRWPGILRITDANVLPSLDPPRLTKADHQRVALQYIDQANVLSAEWRRAYLAAENKHGAGKDWPYDVSLRLKSLSSGADVLARASVLHWKAAGVRGLPPVPYDDPASWLRERH